VDGNDYVEYRPYTNSAAIYIHMTMPQVEVLKGYATPFVREGNGGTGTYNARPASVNLMIHGDVGTGQTFSDSSPSKHTITAYADTTHSAAQSKFNGGSIYFDGTGDYLDVGASTGFAFGTGDFTVDAFVYTDNTTADSFYRRIYMTDGPTGNGATNPQLAIVPTTGLANAWSTSGSLDLSSTTNVADGAWHHIAMVRSSGTVTLYVDGASEATQSWTENVALNSGSPRPRIGSYDGSTGDFDGYIDEIRVTTGTALWLSAFTPPTRRNLSAPVVDRSSNDNGGNFATTAMTDTTTYRVGEVIRPIGSAVWDFDGTDDKISANSKPITPVSMWTVSAWIYLPDTSGREWIYSQFSNTYTIGDFGIAINSADVQVFEFRKNSNTAENDTIWSSSGGVDDDMWQHIVVSRTGTGISNVDDLKIYVNGELIKEGGGDTAGSFGTSSVFGYAIGFTDADYALMKISNLQVYDTPITDQQVKENFNQQRSRFDI